MGLYDKEILANARIINRLKSHIDETVLHRNENEEKLREWQQACQDFHEQYDSLAFPGGFDGAFERLMAGDPKTMEAAISFLECRPYFLRSGYICKDLLRKAKRAPREDANWHGGQYAFPRRSVGARKIHLKRAADGMPRM